MQVSRRRQSPRSATLAWVSEPGYLAPWSSSLGCLLEFRQHDQTTSVLHAGDVVALVRSDDDVRRRLAQRVLPGAAAAGSAMPPQNNCATRPELFGIFSTSPSSPSRCEQEHGHQASSRCWPRLCRVSGAEAWIKAVRATRRPGRRRLTEKIKPTHCPLLGVPDCALFCARAADSCECDDTVASDGFWGLVESLQATVHEFTAYAKANPGKINLGSPGIGTPPHVAGELFKVMAGVDLVHVSWRGTRDGRPGNHDPARGITPPAAHLVVGRKSPPLPGRRIRTSGIVRPSMKGRFSTRNVRGPILDLDD
jgi:Tripartite tricarboxylate transporter family receptor